VGCSSVFAYGTLKQDQLRGSMWPKRPIRIEPAVVNGELWDLGSYPGLCAGSDSVLGELWTFADRDIAKTLEVLDGIEGYDFRSDRGLYLRREIDVRVVIDRSPCEKPQKAYGYLIPDIGMWPRARRIEPWWTWESKPRESKLAVWPDQESYVPSQLSDEDV
jgi:gamma-glutamylcyclotransferase (GGCT)/AIG2-like uncharacterized protein YtfP